MNPLRYLASPAPFPEVSASTNKEIKERISYADSLIMHPHFDVSEKARDDLLAYSAACQDLVDTKNKEDREAIQALIIDYEQTLKNNDGPAKLSFDLATKTKMGEEIDNLWGMWAYTRYEKYLPKAIMDEAKSHPSAQETDPWHRAFWTPFQGRLDAEAEAFSKVLKGQNNHNECPTYLLLALLCERHTLDWDETVALIKACASGEEIKLPDTDLAELIKKGDTAALAKRLDRDEASVSLSSEYVMGVGSLVLAFYAATLPDTLFEMDEPDTDKWTPKKALQVFMELKDGHEDAVRMLMSEMFEQMVDDQFSDSDIDGAVDEWEDEDEDGAFSDDSEDY
ncbi:hypothetical protein BDV25DRAFT_171461 [Aspergillus avenaceus]|uniref:Uncharacterized protein n=1 Tax=Aspergillus avenaceus TaxID=36643 RepID=A0A5N6TYH5_ASPAV|nr:hypothetical protein BDV25DRAFT_171461 [Aspergillus avenaceus]